MKTNPYYRSGFLQVLDKYTNLGIYVVHHSFTLVELFALSGIQFTSQTIKSGLMVNIIFRKDLFFPIYTYLPSFFP